MRSRRRLEYEKTLFLANKKKKKNIQQVGLACSIARIIIFSSFLKYILEAQWSLGTNLKDLLKRIDVTSENVRIVFFDTWNVIFIMYWKSGVCSRTSFKSRLLYRPGYVLSRA